MDFSNISTPSDYRAAAFLAGIVAQAMQDRLTLMKLNPRWVIDLGCGVGRDMQALALLYPEARVCGLDWAYSFLQDARRQQKNDAWVTADATSLPFSSHSVDLIFANLLFPWVKDYLPLLQECRRVLRPNGLLLFSCLGPDTFKEWTALETRACFLPHLEDMHPIGDTLLKEGFTDPVLEVEDLTFTYRSFEQLSFELEKSGMISQISSEMEKGNSGGVFSVTFEIIYGHAWCPSVKGFKPDEQGVVTIPLSQLK